MAERISKAIYHYSSGDLRTVFNVTLTSQCDNFINAAGSKCKPGFARAAVPERNQKVPFPLNFELADSESLSTLEDVHRLA